MICSESAKFKECLCLFCFFVFNKIEVLKSIKVGKFSF